MAKQINPTVQKNNKKTGTDKVHTGSPISLTESKEEQSVLAAFKKHLESEGKTASTIKSYLGDTETFFAYCKAKGIALENGVITRKDVLEYKDTLIERNARAATVNVVLNSIRSYNAFAIKTGLMAEMVVETKTDRVTNAELAALRANNKA